MSDPPRLPVRAGVLEGTWRSAVFMPTCTEGKWKYFSTASMEDSSM